MTDKPEKYVKFGDKLILNLEYVNWCDERIAELEKQVEEYETLKKRYPTIIPSLVLAANKKPKE